LDIRLVNRIPRIFDNQRRLFLDPFTHEIRSPEVPSICDIFHFLFDRWQVKAANIILSDVSLSYLLETASNYPVASLFENFLSACDPDHDYGNIVFDYFWRLSVSPCYELFLRAISALLHIGARHRNSFLSRFQITDVIIPLLNRLIFLRKHQNANASKAVLLVFGELTRLNSQSQNLLLFCYRNLLPGVVVQILGFDLSQLYLLRCRIIGNLTKSCSGFVRKAMLGNLRSPFLEGYDSEMDVQCKLAAALIFAYSVANSKENDFAMLIEDRQIIQDFLIFSRSQITKRFCFC
jgi:hypothetical protein